MFEIFLTVATIAVSLLAIGYGVLFLIIIAYLMAASRLDLKTRRLDYDQMAKAQRESTDAAE